MNMNNRFLPPVPPKHETNGVAAAVVNWFRLLYWGALHMYVFCYIEDLGYLDIRWRPIFGQIENRGVVEDRSQRLVRWDSRPPNDIFHHGFYPRVSDSIADSINTSLYDYIEDGSANIYVSTIRTIYDEDGNPLETWVPNDRDENHIYEYEIFAPGGIDVNETLGERSPFPEQQEIAFPGGIHRRFIRSVRQYYQGQLIRIWINPHFEARMEQPSIQAAHETEFLWWYENHPQGGDRNDSDISNTKGVRNMSKFNPDERMNGHNGRRSTKLDIPELEVRRVLADGDYFIKTFTDASQVLEVKSINGEWLSLDKLDGASVNRQKWTLKFDGHSGCYRITTNIDNKNLALTFSNDNENVYLEELSDSEEQLLGISKLNTGGFQILKYRDAHFEPMRTLGFNESNHSIDHYPKNDEINTKWQIEPVDEIPLENGLYRITTKNDHRKAWQVISQSPNTGGGASVDIDVKDISGTTDEIFEIEKVEGGYRIYYTSEGVKYFINPQHGVSGEGKWLLKRNLDGSMSILFAINSLRSHALTFLPQDQRKIDMRPYTASENQCWQFFSAYDNAKFENEYLIHSQSRQNKVFGFRENSHELLIQDIDYSDYQKWEIVYNENNIAYQIVSVADRSLNIRYNPSSNILEMGQGNNSESFWYIEITSNGSLSFRNKIRKEHLITLYGNILTVDHLNEHREMLQEFRLISTHNSLENGRYKIGSILYENRSLSWKNRQESIMDHALFHLEAEWKVRYSSSKQAYTIMNARHDRDGLYYSMIGADVCKRDLLDQDLRKISNDEEDRKYWIFEFRPRIRAFVIRNKFDPNIVLVRYSDSLKSRVIAAEINHYDIIQDNYLWDVNKLPRN